MPETVYNVGNLSRRAREISDALKTIGINVESVELDVSHRWFIFSFRGQIPDLTAKLEPILTQEWKEASRLYNAKVGETSFRVFCPPFVRLPAIPVHVDVTKHIDVDNPLCNLWAYVH